MGESVAYRESPGQNGGLGRSDTYIHNDPQLIVEQLLGSVKIRGVS